MNPQIVFLFKAFTTRPCFSCLLPSISLVSFFIWLYLAFPFAIAIWFWQLAPTFIVLT